MSAYHELYWSSPDGLRLHARDYPADHHDLRIAEPLRIAEQEPATHHLLEQVAS